MISQHPREELISAMADGMLDVADMRRVAAHLHECAPCRTILSDFEANKSLFRALPKPEPPPSEFWEGTFRKMRGIDQRGDSRPSPIRSWNRPLRAALAAAACIGAVILAPLMHTASTQQTPVESPAAAAEDTLDAIDVSYLVRAHTQSVAAQPLSDPRRQQMIAADVETGPLDDQAARTESADVAP